MMLAIAWRTGGKLKNVRIANLMVRIQIGALMNIKQEDQSLHHSLQFLYMECRD
jgi:hypothetical protein